MAPSKDQDTGLEKGAKGVTSTLGNTVGGLTNTVGGIVGATGRGLGETVSGATGSKAAGKPLGDVGNSVQDGTESVAKTTKDAGEWKT